MKRKRTEEDLQGVSPDFPQWKITSNSATFNKTHTWSETGLSSVKLKDIQKKLKNKK